jgi:hypothetical protein
MPSGEAEMRVRNCASLARSAASASARALTSRDTTVTPTTPPRRGSRIGEST